MIALSTFPAPLLRLILCGGGGLSPAWGPLVAPGWGDWAYSWDPIARDVTFPRGMSDEGGGPPRPLDGAMGWSLPLDANSPWPARLATVAAWMLSVEGVAHWCGDDGIFVSLNTVTKRCSIIQRAWSRRTGALYYGSVPAPNLPTLPQHLAPYPLEAAVVLALYDVPEINARVDAP